MKNKTRFYELLISARTDEDALILAINKIEPLINQYSKIEDKEEIDQDLKSYLIEYAIKLIKDENFAEKLAK